VKKTFVVLWLALAPALAQMDWLAGLDWGGISSNLQQVGQVMSCNPGSLAQLDFSQPSLVLRGVYRVTKCVLCLTLKMCGLPDDMLYPASWGEVLQGFRGGGDVLIVGSGAGVKALTDYLIAALGGGACQNISYGGVPIYTCPEGGIRVAKAFVVTDPANAREIKAKLRNLQDPNLFKVVGVGGERDAPELSRVLLGLPMVYAGRPFMFAPGYSTPDRWLWLTFDGPTADKVLLVLRLATQYVASAAQREEESK
jgi:hypothetical protein